MERPELIEKVRMISKDMWILGPIHGVMHWDRVYNNGMRLCMNDDRVNKRVVWLFAYLHDCCRENDGNDDQHGYRASQFITIIRNTVLKEVTDEEIMLLKRACELHTSTHRIGDPTIDACFDADRLDLTRCGIIPDSYRMATKRGADIARMLKYCNGTK